MKVELSQLCSIAALALLGTFIAWRLRVSLRFIGLVPVVLAVLIVWLFGERLALADVLGQGVSGGLMAAGILGILLGLCGRMR